MTLGKECRKKCESNLEFGIKFPDGHQELGNLYHEVDEFIPISVFFAYRFYRYSHTSTDPIRQGPDDQLRQGKVTEKMGLHE